MTVLKTKNENTLDIEHYLWPYCCNWMVSIYAKINKRARLIIKTKRFKAYVKCNTKFIFIFIHLFFLSFHFLILFMTIANEKWVRQTRVILQHVRKAEKFENNCSTEIYTSPIQ